MPELDNTHDAPEETRDGQTEEYVFRFRLDPQEDAPAYEDPLVELIRGQLADLLDAVVLMERGRRVRVDGFRLLQDPETQYEIFPKSSQAED